MKRTLTALLISLLVAAPLMAFSWEKPAAKVERSVQRMSMSYTDDFGNTGQGACTAFSINDLRDYFLTAAHCFGTDMTVGGHEARLVLLDEASDLMVLMVPQSGEVPEVKFASLRTCPKSFRDYVCQGEDVAAMGFGFGGDVPLLKTGTVSYPDVRIPEIGPNEHILLVGFTYIPGMSGGPVFNSDGKLVGIVQFGNYYIGGGRTLTEILNKIGEYLK